MSRPIVFGAFAFSPDGRWLVTQDSKHGGASLWELPARRLAQAWATPRFQSAVFTTNGGWLTASVGTTNEPPCVRFYSHAPAEGTGSADMLVRGFTGLSRPVSQVGHANRPPGELATGKSPAPADKNVRPTLQSRAAGVRGQRETQAPPAVCDRTNLLHGIPSPCSAIAIAPDGQSTVTGHHDGTVALWETQSGRLLQRAERAFTNSIGYRSRITRSAINPLVFSRHGRTLAAASFDLVEVGAWTLPELRRLGGHWFGARCGLPLAITPDGRQLALGGMYQGLSVNLWATDLRQPGSKLRGHRDFLCAAGYSPGGRTLASGGGDGLLKLWQRATARELGVVLSLPPGVQFAQLTFSPDGDWLGASDTTGGLHLFHAPPLAEIDRAP